MSPDSSFPHKSFRQGGSRSPGCHPGRHGGERMGGLGRLPSTPQCSRTFTVVLLCLSAHSVFLEDFLATGQGDQAPQLEFEQLPFSHPLFIMFSSGTTGAPKCMVHSAGVGLLGDSLVVKMAPHPHFPGGVPHGDPCSSEMRESCWPCCCDPITMGSGVLQHCPGPSAHSDP